MIIENQEFPEGEGTLFPRALKLPTSKAGKALVDELSG
jgi:hypothetical protein